MMRPRKLLRPFRGKMPTFRFISTAMLAMLFIFSSSNTYGERAFDGFTKAGFAAIIIEDNEEPMSTASVFLEFCEKSYNSYQRAQDFLTAKLFSDFELVDNKGGVGFKANNHRRHELADNYDPFLKNEKELFALSALKIIVNETVDQGIAKFECAAILSVGYPSIDDNKNDVIGPTTGIFSEIVNYFDQKYWLMKGQKANSKDENFKVWNSKSVDGAQGKLSVELMRPIMIIKFEQTAKKVR